jgi:tRNA-2-methylthio-N6-dimethylallyladenosine synthase
MKELIAEGFKEIWFLGQNVNSYNKGDSPDFSDLLKEANQVEGDFWIKFTSSHPKDFSEKLIKTMKECDKVSNYLNLPLQSGDDQILKAMNRPYSYKEYKEKIKKLRKEIPEITLSTDIIVGFPGETKKAFKNTKKALRKINFDMAYIARYSPRPHSKAAQLKDNVSDKEKKRRAKILTKVLKKAALKQNKKKIGQAVDFLPVDYKKGNLIGKTEDYKTIKVEGDEKKINKFQKAKITEATDFGLKGKLI